MYKSSILDSNNSYITSIINSVLVFTGQSKPVFVIQDISENEVFVKNTNDNLAYNQSTTNRWDLDNNIEQDMIQQGHFQTFSDNHAEVLALPSFYDRPEYR